MTIAKCADIMNAVDKNSANQEGKEGFASMVDTLRMGLTHLNDVYVFDYRDLNRIAEMAGNTYWSDGARGGVYAMYLALTSLGGSVYEEDNRKLFQSAEDLMVDLTAGLGVFDPEESLSELDGEFLRRVGENWQGVFFLRDGVSDADVVDIAREVYGDIAD